MSNGSTILAVDDSPTQLAALKESLENAGLTVRTARNGLEAIKQVYICPPDLIVSDILMPEINGYHLCRVLKNDPNSAHIPIILLSRLNEPHDLFWSEHAGADRYLEKSNDLSVVSGAVLELLANLPLPAPESAEPAQPLDAAEIHEQLTGVLDRLLYESTISNEILKLTGQTHDSRSLAREFLLFLSKISRYTLAGLLLKDGPDKYQICLHAQKQVCSGAMEHAKKELIRQANIDLQTKCRLRFQLIENDGDDLGEATASLGIVKSISVAEDSETLAQIVLFDAPESSLTSGMHHALDIAANRFLVVARYLKKIWEIEEVKADFVSMLVHDMRSPLTGISGFSDVLAEQILGPLNRDQKQALSNVQNNCDRLLHLIDDILDHSKLEAGKMQAFPKPLDVKALIEQVLSNMSIFFADNDLAITLTIPLEIPLAMGDEKQLTRVLVNLLTNAAKFTSPGGHIAVRLTVVPPSPQDPRQRIRVDIQDTGPGIPVSQQEHLFNRYQQLPSSGMFRKGTGLGLAICKELIGLHHGEIWVESPAEKSGGSRFSFTLPLAPQHTQSAYRHKPGRPLPSPEAHL